MFKRFKIIICFLVLAFELKSQNLVPNSSFENYSSCPNGISQSFILQDWINFGATPDYHSSCASLPSSVSTPQNFGGFQIPFSGDGYVTLSCWNNSESDLREYLGAKLIDTLIVGTKYYVSFKVSPCFQNPIDGGLGFTMINNFGVYFSQQPLDSMLALANNKSQFYSSTVITDTSLWSTIKGSFIADSAYTYLSIGNFMADSLTTIDSTYISGYNMVSKEAYYYFDHICVTDDSLFNEQYAVNLNAKVESQFFSIFPNPTFNYFTINSKYSTEIQYIELYNSFGNLISTQNKCDSFNTNNLEEGMYILKIYYSNKSYSIAKLIKQTK